MGVLSRLVLTGVVLQLAGVAAGAAEINRWSGLSSPTFTQGFARSACLNQPPCQEDELTLGGNTFVDCSAAPSDPYSCTEFVSSLRPWSVGGFAGHLPGPPPADLLVGATVSVEGELDSPTTLLVRVTSGASFSPPQNGSAGVFRFAGDPSVFDGVEAISVGGLVSLGLIAADDVLLDVTFEVSEPSSTEAVHFLDITGIPQDEIVVFAAGNGPSPTSSVPATGTMATGALAAALMAIAAWILVRRRRAA